jgi:hypothetical protein
LEKWPTAIKATYQNVSLPTSQLAEKSTCQKDNLPKSQLTKANLTKNQLKHKMTERLLLTLFVS